VEQQPEVIGIVCQQYLQAAIALRFAQQHSESRRWPRAVDPLIRQSSTAFPPGWTPITRLALGIFGWGSRLLLTAPPTVFSLVLASFHVQALIRGDAAEQHRIDARQPIGV
jgi:hypothetical protein